MDKENKDSNKKKKPLIITIILVSLFAIIDIVLSIIFIPKMLRNKQSSNNNDKYQLDEYTEARYLNLLTYINNEATFLGAESPTEIVAMQYTVNSHFDISYKTESNAGYIKIDIAKPSVDEALDIFKEGLPSSGITTIQKEEICTTKTYNGVYEENINLVTTFTTKTYISYTAKCDCGALISLSHKEYQDDGKYSEQTLIKKEEDKLLFDFYYYLLNK